jgi:RND family efflux transporter MFP subunit
MLFARVTRPLAWRAAWLVVAGPLVVSGCQDDPANGAGGPGGRGAMPPMPVVIETLAPKPVEQATEFVATVKSRRSSTVQPQVEGFITRIHVNPGQRVSRGTPLFDIDAATQQAAVAGLESVRAARQADAVYARQQADRAKALRDVGAMSEQEYEAALTLQKTAEAQLQAIEDQIRQQRAELAYYRVTAPTAGVVGDVPVRVGDRVTRATMLTTISDNSAGLELYINVPVQEATRLKPGLRVLIVGDRSEVIGTEQANFVSPTVDDSTQTVLVKAPITRGQFRSDQFVRTRIVWTTEPTIVIPLTSVMRISGQYFAFVAEGAEGHLVARQRGVVLGPVVGNAYVVLDGLRAGDRLIVSGIQKIGDGSPVQPAPPGAPPEGSDPGRGDAGRGGRGGE